MYDSTSYSYKDKAKKVAQNYLPKVIFGVIDQVGFGHIFLNN